MQRACAVVLACGFVGGCSSDAQHRGAPERSPDPSPPIVLTPLPSPDPQRPFQHAAEVSIAAHDGHVVVAAINFHSDGPDTLDFARRYTPGTTWGPEMKIDAIDLIGGAAASVMSPILGMNGSGVAVAAWYYDIASPDVYANVTR